MYVPRHFSQDDTAVAHDLIRSNVFATRVTEVSGRLDATHVPVVLDAERGELRSLRFHLARANPTVKALAETHEVLMVFSGPNAYISPDWYANEANVQPVSLFNPNFPGRSMRLLHCEMTPEKIRRKMFGTAPQTSYWTGRSQIKN